MKNNRKKVIYIVLLLVLIISVGYAALSTIFNLNSSISLKKVSFDIHFDNVAVLNSTAVVTEDAHITNEAKTEISFSIGLNDLDDHYKFTTDIVNEGKIPGKINSIELTGISESQKRLIKYRAYYTTSNKDVVVGDYVGPLSTKNITVEVVYELAEDITTSDIPTNDVTLDCVFRITIDNASITEYKQALIPNVISKDVTFFPSNLLDYTRPSYSEQHEGLYRLDETENDPNPIYFYRGSNDYVFNHIVFANYCWRIVRTTNYGGTKIIYDGEPDSDGKCLNTGADTQFPETAFGDSTVWETSSLKMNLNTWYFENLLAYQQFIEDEVYCNDYGTNEDPISFECPEEYQVSVANGRNDYPFGLINVYETRLSGLGMDMNYSCHSWLCNEKSSWTITRAMDSGYWGTPGMYYSRNDGYVGYDIGADTMAYWSRNGARPVITLNNAVRIDSGDGTSENPYTIEY